MRISDSRGVKGAVALVAVAMLTGAIGVVLSAQMAQRRAQLDGQGMGPGGPGMMGHGRGMRGGPGGPFGGPGGGMFGLLGPGMRELDLTDAQRDQVRGIVESHQDERKAIGDRMMTARKALQEAITADAIDEGAIKARVNEVAAVEADQAILQAKLHAAMVGVLTPEQQQKLKELRSQMEQRMKDGRARMRQPSGERGERMRGRPAVV
jgi:protein CpxP